MIAAVARHRWIGLAAVAAALALLAAGSAARAETAAAAPSLAPEMLLPGDPAWDDLWRLELSGVLPAGITSMRPAPRGEVARWIQGASSDPRADAASLARLRRAFARELRREGYGPAERETRATIHLRDPAGPSANPQILDGARSEIRVGPEIGAQARGGDGRAKLGDSTRVGVYGVYLYSNRLALQGEIFAGRVEGGRRIGDPLINHTDILYLSEDAEANAALGDLRVTLARTRRHWGEGPSGSESLLIDREAPPITSIEWDLALPVRIRFASWTGTLNAFEKRGIAAHRLEVPLGRDLRVSLSEGVRYTGGFGDPLYLLGILPYTLVQRLDAQDTKVASLRAAQRNNVLADAEVVWRPRPGAIAFGEVLVDDLPAATGHDPARIGGRAGVSMMPVLGGTPVEIDLTGTKVGRYVYAVSYSAPCECDWIQQDRSIGNPDGPDQEALRLRAVRSIGRDHRLAMDLLYANRGAGRLGEAWTGGTGSDASTRRALEVSGPVERERRLTIGWRWDPRDNLFLEGMAGGAFLRNPGNVPSGGYDARFLWMLEGGWRL
jgi:hypothetical protein